MRIDTNCQITIDLMIKLNSARCQFLLLTARQLEEIGKDARCSLSGFPRDKFTVIATLNMAGNLLLLVTDDDKIIQRRVVPYEQKRTKDWLRCSQVRFEAIMAFIYGRLEPPH